MTIASVGRWPKRSIGWAPLAVSAVVASCATTPVGETVTARTFSFATHTVPAPEGDGWGVSRDDAVETVTFRKARSTLSGQIVASTEIRVFKVLIRDDAVTFSEAALADGFRDQEHRTMSEQGVARGSYRLDRVTKAVETVAGRTLYTMRYEIEAPGPGWMPIRGESALFLYFPPDYAGRRAFYGFLIAESWVKGNLYASPDLKRIEPVIAGFAAR